MFATGDKGGRVVIFQRDPVVCIAKYITQIYVLFLTSVFVWHDGNEQCENI